MYSDRIHHAFAFMAKHYPERISRYDGESCLIRASSVAVILARYGADESTIVASVLKNLFDACPQHRLDSLARDILSRFGPTVAFIVDAASEPRYDPLGRERAWKAAKFEHLARLAAADPPAVDLCVAEEMHRIGAALVSIRRLGFEYLDPGGIPSPSETLWWMRALSDTIHSHLSWRRPEMRTELHRLATELAGKLTERT